MRLLYKGILVAALAFCMASATAFAAETEEVHENISFNYQENTFSIDAGTGVGAVKELTVMLVKGDLSDSEASLSDIDVNDVYYVGQKIGTDYDIFENLGVKYDTDKFDPGIYTLITSGENETVKKTKLIIGNALNGNETKGSYLPKGWEADDYSFGSVSKTVRYYPDDNEGKYIYVCYASFPPMTSLENAGFVFQNIGTSTKHVVKSLSNDFTSKIMDGINSINSGIDIGIQVNDVPVDSVQNIIAIPYVKN